MASERFPKAKYIRQLRRMREDLWWWTASYKQAAENTPVEWLQGRFIDRGAVLEDVLHRIDQVVDGLDALPRLS